MKIYIADFQTGMPASLGRVVGLRMFAWGLVAWFPVIPIIDIIFFFREDRRCLHDMFAGTVVYKN